MILLELAEESVFEPRSPTTLLSGIVGPLAEPVIDKTLWK
jgi:hypothetical protein